MQTVRPVRTTTAAVSVTLVGLVLAGCADTAQQAAREIGLTPAARVDAAVSSVLETDRLTVTASLDLDDADRAAITALATEEGASAGVVERVLGTRVIATTITTEGLLSDLDLPLDGGAVPTSLSSSVALEVEGTTLGEVRQLGSTVYARVDVAAVEAAFEQDGLADDLTTGPDEAPAEVAGAVEALVAGEWVSVDTADLAADLAAELEQLGLTGAAGEAQDTDRATAAVEGFLSEAAEVLRREVVVTETSTDAYDVTAPLEQVLTSLTPSVTALVGELVVSTGSLDALGGEDPDALAAEITAGVQEGLEGLQDELDGRSATVQVGLEDDHLASARLDLVQLLDENTREEMSAEGVTALPVLLTFAREGEVGAPEGATAVDLGGLFEGMAGEALMGVPMTDLLEQGAAGVGSGGSAVSDGLLTGEPVEMTAAELEESGLTAESLGLSPGAFASYLEDLGIVPVP